MTRRTERLGELLRAELSDLIRREVKDPRVGDMVTISSVTVSADLRQAKVMISMYGGLEERNAAIQGLRTARGFLQRHLLERLKVRRIPTLDFELDRSIERGAHILQMISDVTREMGPAEGDGTTGRAGAPADGDRPGGS